MQNLTRRPGLIFFVAFLYRVALCAYFLFFRGMPAQWTGEVSEIAHSLVLHHTFAGAYHGSSGPTAWIAPAYPFIVAGIFWLFGIDSRASAVVFLLLNALFSSLAAVLIYRLGREFLAEKVGRLAAWAWAVSPLVAVITFLLWDTCLSALMFCLSFLVLLRAKTLREWIAAGVLWGCAALVSPTLLAPLPAIVGFRLWNSQTRLKFALAFCLTITCVLLPWSIRNRREMHATFLVRSNLWAEIYFGNVSFNLFPGLRSGLYQQVGETRFVEQLRVEAIQYIAAHPGEFVRMTMKRTLRFWLMPYRLLPLTATAALGCWLGAIWLLRDCGASAIPFVAVPVFYPIVYCITHAEARYRHPIEPIAYLLAAYAVTGIGQRWRARTGDRMKAGRTLAHAVPADPTRARTIH